MSSNNWSLLGHHKELNLNYFQAFHAAHSYPRHSHDYYVVAVVDRGLQSFSFATTKFVTPINGLILLNPGEMHTGEPVNELGFGYSAFYPTVEHIRTTLQELPGSAAIPAFAVPRADDMQMAGAVRSLHAALRNNESSLEVESKFLWTLVELIRRFGDRKPAEQKIGYEHLAVKKMRRYIEENYARAISLSELAEYVHLSRYYLLHLFRNETGMPPHTYLETVRVQQAQRLLAKGQPLPDVAYQVGFGSQSHFTHRFKKIIGITPGEYAKQLKQ
ncbi:MAG TPA: AraC family transcriptional regulator [Chloroflexia bacterium]|nr:AraC family transcriptional regulator [Chloroflexia bacterium]